MLYLISSLETVSFNSVIELDGDSCGTHGSEDIVDLADLVFISQVNRSHEKGDLVSHNIADH
jgi:hypothetical protein